MIVLAGCGGQEAGQVIDTSSPIQKNIDTPTATITSYPTRTPLPLPSPEGFGESTWDVISASPNGEWIAWFKNESGKTRYLLVERVDQSLYWEIFFDFSKTDWYTGMMIPYYWSLDGQHLYYAITGTGCCSFQNVYLLFGNLNLFSGENTTILPPNINHPEDYSDAYAVAITKNSDQLAYIPYYQDEIELFILNLITGSEKSIKIQKSSNFLVGEMIWSPDETRLAFQSETEIGFYFVIIDVNTLSHKKIEINEVDASIFLENWLSDTQIELFNGQILDIETGEIE